MNRLASSRPHRTMATALLLAALTWLVPGTVSGREGFESPVITASAAQCGPLDGSLFRFDGASVDPVMNAQFRVGATTYATSDFHRSSLAVLELAWIARKDVCITVDSTQRPIGASASVDVCGDVLIGATVWLFQNGTGELDANGTTNERRGFIDDTLMGFVWLSLGGDPTPPNFFNTLKVAAVHSEPDDCITASLSWTAPNDPVVAATLSTSECLVADVIDARVATFIEPIENSVYQFSLTPGSSVEAVFKSGERGGVHIASERGLDGSVAIGSIPLAGCSAAPVDPPATPNATIPVTSPQPKPSVSTTPSVEPSTAAPSLLASPAGSAPARPTPTQSLGTVAAGIATTASISPVDPSSAAATSPLPIVGLLVAALLALAAVGMFWQFVLRRQLPATSRVPDGPSDIPDGAITRSMPVPLERIGLTAREREVLAMVAAGMSNREIGGALYITESTAGVHVSNILGKLGVGSRTEAARYAIDAGVEPANPSGRVN